jgi:[Skp1-protein]-hydroxyproline N-acetylglucosaminyltransferase
MDARQARGPCWARNIARSLWSGEDFYLQVDAHMRFRRGWDVYLVDLHATCRDTCNSAEPVISTYPPNYEVSQNGWDMPTDIRPTVLVHTYT